MQYFEEKKFYEYNILKCSAAIFAVFCLTACSLLPKSPAEEAINNLLNAANTGNYDAEDQFMGVDSSADPTTNGVIRSSYLDCLNLNAEVSSCKAFAETRRKLYQTKYAFAKIEKNSDTSYTATVNETGLDTYLVSQVLDDNHWIDVVEQFADVKITTDEFLKKSIEIYGKALQDSRLTLAEKTFIERKYTIEKVDDQWKVTNVE